MIYIVNGAPRSGKDTFCNKVIDIVTEEYGIIISTVDLVKQIAYDLGWNGEKTPKDRKFLSDLKDLLTEWNDIPIKDVKKKIKNFLSVLSFYEVEVEPVIFIMCREPKEIKRLCKELNAKSVLIRRKEVESEKQSNHADSEILNYDYDIIIDNNEDLYSLSYKALDFVEKEKLFFPHWKTLEIDLFGNIRYN